MLKLIPISVLEQSRTSAAPLPKGFLLNKLTQPTKTSTRINFTFDQASKQITGQRATQLLGCFGQTFLPLCWPKYYRLVSSLPFKPFQQRGFHSVHEHFEEFCLASIFAPITSHSVERCKVALERTNIAYKAKL